MNKFIMEDVATKIEDIHPKYKNASIFASIKLRAALAEKDIELLANHKIDVKDTFSNNIMANENGLFKLKDPTKCLGTDVRICINDVIYEVLAMKSFTFGVEDKIYIAYMDFDVRIEHDEDLLPLIKVLSGHTTCSLEQLQQELSYDNETGEIV